MAVALAVAPPLRGPQAAPQRRNPGTLGGQRYAAGREGEEGELLGLSAERAGLTGDLLERYPHEVSEGQLQRACLARALILEPRYLICDEPSSMLDVSTQAALLEAISAEQEKRDLGVLPITHDRILADHW